MYTNIFNNIDNLIAMALNNMSKEEINKKLIKLNSDLETKNQEINNLTQTLEDANYINASLELIDKNIQVSLEQKITKLKYNLADLDQELTSLKNQETTTFTQITALKEDLATNLKYLDTLSQKNYPTLAYKKIVNKEKEHHKYLENQLAQKEKEYAEILKKLELNKQAQVELELKLNTFTKRLEEIKNSLKNPNSYIDEKSKNADNAKLAQLKAQKASLDKQKLELLCDASIIASDAKEYILAKDNKNALAKLKELVTIIKAKPYMDNNDLKGLSSQLEKQETLRSELVTLMDNKNYELASNDFITQRISLITNTFNQNKEQIVQLKAQIKAIDDYINTTLGTSITTLEEYEVVLEANLVKLETALKEENSKDIQKTQEKKQQELTILKTILKDSQEDLVASLQRNQVLSDLITSLEKENQKYQEELTNLKNYQKLDLKAIDVLEFNQDKERLQKFNADIKNLKNRLLFPKSVDELYDEIEMELASLNTIKETPKPITNQVEESIDTLESVPLYKVINMRAVETIRENA